MMECWNDAEMMKECWWTPMLKYSASITFHHHCSIPLQHYSIIPFHILEVAVHFFDAGMMLEWYWSEIIQHNNETRSALTFQHSIPAFHYSIPYFRGSRNLPTKTKNKSDSEIQQKNSACASQICILEITSMTIGRYLMRIWFAFPLITKNVGAANSIYQTLWQYWYGNVVMSVFLVSVDLSTASQEGGYYPMWLVIYPNKKIKTAKCFLKARGGGLPKSIGRTATEKQLRK